MKKLQWTALGLLWMQLFIILLVIVGLDLSAWWLIPWVVLMIGFTRVPD
jgi:hypothetical protein